MDAKTFNAVLDRQMKRINAVLGDKAVEYADDVDRLRNFKIAAELQGITPREALGGMLAKHIVSIYDLISGEDLAPMYMWEEKITDAQNYLVLLRALVEEEEADLKRETDTDAP